MASNHFSCSIAEDPIAEIESRLQSSTAFGADIRFHGVVRKMEDGKEIRGIRYSFYEAMALREMQSICRELLDQNPDHEVLIYHRVGEVAAGEASILIRVQTPHSQEAFQLISEYLKRIKKRVPIWKQPLFL